MGAGAVSAMVGCEYPGHHSSIHALMYHVFQRTWAIRSSSSRPACRRTRRRSLSARRDTTGMDWMRCPPSYVKRVPKACFVAGTPRSCGEVSEVQYVLFASPSGARLTLENQVQLPSYIWTKAQLVRYGFDPDSTWTFLASSSIAGVILVSSGCNAASPFRLFPGFVVSGDAACRHGASFAWLRGSFVDAGSIDFDEDVQPAYCQGPGRSHSRHTVQ